MTASNLIIGETYYLMTDGKSGDVCDYSFELLNGTTLSPPMPKLSLPAFYAKTEPVSRICRHFTNANLTFEWSTQDGNILSGAQTPVIEIDSAELIK
ncbi:MAG: hypothetical protein R2788_10285 [Saprospiraceae bacterium]